MLIVNTDPLQADEARDTAERFGLVDALQAASWAKLGGDVLDRGEAEQPPGMVRAYVLNSAQGELTLIEYAEAWGFRGRTIHLPTPDREGIAAGFGWVAERWPKLG